MKKLFSHSVPQVFLFLFATISPSTILTFQVQAAGLSLSAFKSGMPNTAGQEGPEIELFTVEKLKVSPDLKSIMRLDDHFSITASTQMLDGAGDKLGANPEDKTNKSKRVLIPYRGPMETRYQTNSSRALQYAMKDVRLGSTNLAVWSSKAIDSVIEMGLLKNHPMKIKIYDYCKEMLNAFYSPNDNVICIGHLQETLAGKKPPKDKSVESSSAIPLERLTPSPFAPYSFISYDADVVIHELGHGIFHHLQPKNEALPLYFSFGNDLMGAANEGQADFVAFATTGNKDFAPWITQLMKEYFKIYAPLNYEAVKNKKALREIVHDFNLKDNYFGEIHSDGKIFTGALYDLSVKIGIQNAFTLWMNAVPAIVESDNFYDLAKHMLEVDAKVFNGANAQDITDCFEKRFIMGNKSVAQADELKLNFALIDDPAKLKIILDDLDVSSEEQKKLLANNNSDGVLSAGECASLELSISNGDSEEYIGTEIFVPSFTLPKGVHNEGANRFYFGTIKGHATFPKVYDIKDKQRPWMLVCVDKTFTDEKAEIEIVVRNSASEQKVLKISPFLNNGDFPNPDAPTPKDDKIVDGDSEAKSHSRTVAKIRL